MEDPLDCRPTSRSGGLASDDQVNRLEVCPNSVANPRSTRLHARKQTPDCPPDADLLDHDPADWKGTLIIRSLLTEPEAILVVREALAVDSHEHWDALREALIRQAGQIAWLSPDQREALDRVVS